MLSAAVVGSLLGPAFGSAAAIVGLVPAFATVAAAGGPIALSAALEPAPAPTGRGRRARRARRRPRPRLRRRRGCGRPYSALARLRARARAHGWRIPRRGAQDYSATGAPRRPLVYRALAAAVLGAGGARPAGPRGRGVGGGRRRRGPSRG